MSDSAGNSSEVPQMSQMNYVAEPLGLRIFRLTIYVVIFLLATVGNALVIFVVYKTRELHTGKSEFEFVVYGKENLLSAMPEKCTLSYKRFVQVLLL